MNAINSSKSIRLGSCPQRQWLSQARGHAPSISSFPFIYLYFQFNFIQFCLFYHAMGIGPQFYDNIYHIIILTFQPFLFTNYTIICVVKIKYQN